MTSANPWACKPGYSSSSVQGRQRGSLVPSGMGSFMASMTLFFLFPAVFVSGAHLHFFGSPDDDNSGAAMQILLNEDAYSRPAMTSNSDHQQQGILDNSDDRDYPWLTRSNPSEGSSTFSDDYIVLEPRSGGTRLRFGKRTRPMGFNVRGTRLRFGKRAGGGGGGFSRSRVQTRGARLRFGKRSEFARFRFGKRVSEDFEDPATAEQEFFYAQEDEAAADNEENEQGRWKKSSSRLRFGKKSSSFDGSEGTKSVRMRFGKRGPDPVFFAAPSDVYKRLATRLRFGKR
ncbi:unnamed protein product [Notodromas monacha]|uniref:Uncharacterized protein n=1 Tax=Notodromas monacha TaxID=399045 RepID=A0A7R9BJI0_9CRUS|nr:unnamed protein product [Notodromas monacha]CAG0915528.1 unnamed protein product [Notodromas monacha]